MKKLSPLVPNIDAQDKLGWTPLHWSALLGNASITKVLLDHQANINICDSAGWTPIHYAKLNPLEENTHGNC